MKSYLFVCFVSDATPREFAPEAWPLHVTILRPFTTNRPPEALAAIVGPICAESAPLPLYATKTAHFGRNYDIPVTVLELTPALAHLQGAIKEVCAPWISPLSEAFPTFRPHVTKQRTGEVPVGETITLCSLSLVERGQRYRVVATLPLGSS